MAKGRLNMKWARENGSPWNEEACTTAVRNQHFEVLKWLKENGCPLNSIACYSAALRNKSVDILDWLLENGYSLNSDLFLAAISGSVESLQWLKEKGCPWDSRASNGSFVWEFGEFEVVVGEWMSLE